MALFGLVMAAGWLLRQASIVRPVPGFLMVFDTALAFAVCGLALLAGALVPASRRAVKTGTGVALTTLGLLILFEYVFDTRLAIDWPQLHAWLPEPVRDPFPGRPPRAAAVCMVAAGLVFCLVPRVRSTLQAWGVRGLTAVVGGVGAWAATGHLLGLSRILQAHWLSQVPLATALGLVILALALWLDWRAEPWSRVSVTAKDDERIVLAGVVVSAVAVAVTGLAVFGPMQSAMVAMLQNELASNLQSQQAAIVETVGQGIDETVRISRLPLVLGIYSAPSARAAATNHPAGLATVADTLVGTGVSGMVFLDAAGRELGRAGTLLQASPLHLGLQDRRGRAELLWDGTLVLEVQVDIEKDGVRLGAVRAQRRLESLTRSMTEASPMGIPGEFVLCAARLETLHCAPSRLQPQPFETPAVVNGKRLPISYAIDGGTGVIETSDHRGHDVVAAYSSMLGAGFVLKADSADLYAPVRSRAGLLALTLLITVAAGSLILRMAVKPLAKRLVTTREQLRVAIEGSRLAMWDLNRATGTFDFSPQWSAMRGGAAGAMDTSFEAFCELVHPDDLAGLLESMRTAWGPSSGFSADYRVRHASGEWIWIRSRGQVVERGRNGEALRVIGTSVDISEDKRVEQSLRQLNDELRVADEANRIAAAVIQNSEEGVMVIDPGLRIESVNPAFERITGHAAADALGQTPRIMFSGRHDEAFFDQLHEQLDAQGHWHGEIWNQRSNGEVFPQQTSFSVLRDPDGRITHYAALFRDRSAEHQLEAKLRELASFDGLTGIANRRSFDDTLMRELSRARRDARPVSLAMADIDHFKRYNDRHGHPAGDECLRRVARAIAGAVRRAGDLAARYGGEEFVVILPNTDAAAAAIVAEKIRAGVAALELAHGDSSAAAFVTISVGVATWAPQLSGDSFDPAGASKELLSLADQALYRAKASGRNRVAAAPASDILSSPGPDVAAVRRSPQDDPAVHQA